MFTNNKDKRNVLLITDVTSGGGVGTHIGQLAVVAKAAGWKVTVLMEEDDRTATMFEFLTDLNITTMKRKLYRNYYNNRDIETSINQVLEHVKPHLVHVHCGSPRSAILPRLLTIDKKLPLITTEHFVSDKLEINGEMIETIRFLHNNSFAVINVCRENMNLMKNRFGLQSSKQLVIRNGVFIPQNKVERSFDKPILNAITVARLTHQKGIDLLINAIALLDPETQNRLRFTLIGGGELENKLKKMSKDLQIDHLITFKGWVSNVSDYLTNKDLFILPSRAEGQPIALIEALAKTLPCIATKVSGIPEVLGYGKFGTLVAPNNPISLSKAITNFVKNPLHLQRKVESSRSYLKDKYDVEKNMYKVISLWKEATNDYFKK